MFRRYPFALYLLTSIVCLFVFSFSQNSWSQVDSLPQADTSPQDSVEIIGIYLECHYRTKDKIILRELALQVGDKIHRDELELVLEKEKSKIFNTNLFTQVHIFHQEVQTGKVEIILSVNEQWYLFPMPLIDFADRNVNVWWQQFRWDFSRLDWGLRLRQKNFRGRNEDLLLHFQLGFTHKFEAAYHIPYLNKKQTIGLRLHTGYTENNTVGYNTITDTLRFMGNAGGDILHKRFYTGGSLQIRSRFYDRHQMGIIYRNSTIDESVLEANANFFGEGKTRQQFVELSYAFTRDLRDRVAYPLKGYFLQLQVTQQGIGVLSDVNLFTARTELSTFLPINKRLYFGSTLSLKVSFPEEQPYNLMRGMGFGKDVLRGFEQYVIESQQHFISRNTLRMKVLDRTITFWEKLPNQFNKAPVAIYPKVFFDFGYAQNTITQESNQLPNRWLWSTGAGIDIVTYYNMVFRCEYALTSIGIRGLNVGFKAEF
jgi:outer membrane protein assembly factor BamA